MPAKKKRKSPAWTRKAGKNPKGGLNAKGRASYNKQTGGNLKAPVKSVIILEGLVFLLGWVICPVLRKKMVNLHVCCCL